MVLIVSVYLCQQGMHDMFIPSQHLSTSSSSGVVQPSQKKRKADHFNTSSTTIYNGSTGGSNANRFNQQFEHRGTVLSVSSGGAGTGVVTQTSGNSNSGNSNCWTNNADNVQTNSPSANKTQTFFSATHLDSYQRCGQKVCRR